MICRGCCVVTCLRRARGLCWWLSQINGRTLGVRLDEGHTSKRTNNADGQGMMGNAAGYGGGMGVGMGMMNDPMSGEMAIDRVQRCGN